MPTVLLFLDLEPKLVNTCTGYLPQIGCLHPFYTDYLGVRPPHREIFQEQIATYIREAISVPSVNLSHTLDSAVMLDN